jgi:hypothetical protein
MPDLSATPGLPALDSFKVKFRLATLAVYGGSLVFLHYAEVIAERVYDDLCSREGITFSKPMPAVVLVLIMLVFSVPTLLARSRVVIVTNLTAGLITAAGAVLLLFTASNTPYECFTMGGDYEDHTSGLGEFTLWGIFVFLLSFALLFIDLSVWALKKIWLALNSQAASS